MYGQDLKAIGSHLLGDEVLKVITGNAKNGGRRAFNIVPGEPLYAPLVYPVVDHTPRWEDRQLGLFCKITPD